MAPSHFLFSPKWIVLGVNNVCNLHCKMCDVGTKNMDSNFAQNLVGTHPLNMPLELIKKVVDQTAAFFPKSKLGYAFTEPLVYPHLIESLEYANAKNIYTTVTTNALTLRNKADALVDAGLNEIFISLDGPQDIHNEIRGNKKSFQKAIEGIEMLKQRSNSPKITVICAITEWNIGHLKELLDVFRSYEIKEFALMHTQFITKDMAELHNASKWGKKYPAYDSNVDLIDFGKMDLDLLHKEIAEIKKDDYPFRIFFSPELNSLEQLKRYYLEPNEIMGDHCNAVFTNIMVKSDGSVIPAHGRCYNLDIGNVYKDDIKSIWKSAKLNKLRADLMSSGGLFPGCSRCCSAV